MADAVIEANQGEAVYTAEDVAADAENAHTDSLLLRVHHKNRIGNSGHVLDTAQVLLQLLPFLPQRNDLQKSVGKVDEAYKAISEIAAQGGTILFVGTKKQAQDAVKTEAERCGMYYV